MNLLKGVIGIHARTMQIHHFTIESFLSKNYTTSRSAAVDMAFTLFQSASPQKTSDKAPVVIMHGLLGSKTNWKGLGKAISSKTGRQVYTVDARNHGDSPHTPDISYPLLAEDLLHFLERQNIPKAVLMGHSMGGRAVMAAALIEPSVVEKLLVLDISPYGVSDSISSLPIFVEIMRKVQVPSHLNMVEARTYVDNLLLPAVPERGIRQFLLTNLIRDEDGYKWRVNINAIAKNFNPHISTFPVVKRDSYFEGETAFVAGALSDYVRPEEEEIIQDIFPQATFHYIEGAGHWLHADKPAEFLDVVIPMIQG
ncbi:protein ABHD11-like isoform X1 [Penaeus chinensis]|uniref:protein ABHD11-like isoform X1 n=1 Tax=Penaeus chinensis TaxID=139456 RepID=UPI001FB6287B|nr:protein ABHD11-like isoform X1 [Penaeus chinensis]